MDRQRRHWHAQLFALLLTTAAAHACGSSDDGAGLSAGGTCRKPQDCASRVCTAGVCQGGAAGGAFSAFGSTGGAFGTSSLPGSSCTQASDCLSGKCTGGVCESGGSLPNTSCSTGPDCASGICVSGTCQI